MTRMKRWGITLIFIGLVGFILPIFGMQFRLLNLVGEGPAGKLIVAGIGLVLVAIGSKKEQASSNPPPPKATINAGPAPVRTCRKCSRALPANKKFCTACGTPVV